MSIGYLDLSQCSISEYLNQTAQLGNASRERVDAQQSASALEVLP